MSKIDLIDRKMLQELDINSRSPIAAIARKLRISRERAVYRIKRLEEDGIIRKYVTMVNPSRLGYSVYKFFFKFQNMSKAVEKQMIDYLTSNKYVYWIATCQGKWDLNITLFARDVTHLDEITSAFFSKYGVHILEQEFNTTLSVGIMSKDWIFDKKPAYSKAVFVGGKVEDSKIDRIDIEILRIMANNARMSALDISRKIHLTQRTVIYRIKELERKKIILGYSVSLNLEMLDQQFFKSIINFNTMQPQTKSKIVEYCRTIPQLGFFIFCMGSWSLELEIIVKDNNEYFSVMERFRENFPEMKGFETMILKNEHKFDWMPLCYEAGK